MRLFLFSLKIHGKLLLPLLSDLLALLRKIQASGIRQKSSACFDAERQTTSASNGGCASTRMRGHLKFSGFYSAVLSRPSFASREAFIVLSMVVIAERSHH